jgi:phage terminase large subunit-like protein
MFPLPVPHEKRTDPCQFIPDTDDPAGHGEKMWAIMARLKLTQGPLAGKTLGETAPPWQEKFVRSLYGATDPGGNRLMDEALLLIAKKNGKSTFTGMLAIAHVLAFPEERGSGIVLADTKEQAGLVFDSMAATVEADPFLLKRFHVRRYRHDVLHKETNTTLKAIASELASTVGAVPSFYIVDELHLLGMRPKGAALVRQLSSGTAVRSNPLGLYISTAPIGVGSGIYQSMINRARRVLAGEAPEDRLFPVLFELPPDADPDNSQMWWMANPSLGTTFSKTWLEREHGIAKADGDPSTLLHFYSQHLNLPAAERMGVDRWLPLAVWDQCADPTITMETLMEQCEHSIWLSIDAGGRDDPTCIGVLGETEAGQYLYWSHQWLHQDGYEKRKATIPLDEFVAAGDLTVFTEPDGDLTELEAMVGQLKQHVVAIGVDPYGLRELVRRIEDRHELTVHGIPQGWKMTPFIHEAGRAVHGGRLRHHGGPMLRWNIENARIEERHEAVALTKPSGASVGAQKIDGAVALIMALAAAAETPVHRSVYDTRGVLWL